MSTTTYTDSDTTRVPWGKVYADVVACLVEQHGVSAQDATGLVVAIHAGAVPHLAISPYFGARRLSHHDHPALIRREDYDDKCLVGRLREAAKNGALPIGEAWNLMDEAADAVEKLRQVLGDLLSWIPDKPSPPEWRFLTGEHGADAAVQAAREALDAAPTLQ